MKIMHPINNDHLNEHDDPDFDNSLHESLKKAGFIFPENEEDLDHLIEKFSKTAFTIPDELNDPMEILKNGILSINADFNESKDEIIDINLAQAAREGGTIDDEVKIQMEKDRKAAEYEQRNRKDK